MQRLHEASGAESTRLLPTLKLYKINVQLDMTGTRKADEKSAAPKPPPTRGDGVLPTDADKRMIEILQRDLPVESRPFDTWAAEAGVTPDELLDACRVFVDRAYMRRFAAVLNHRKAGFGANGMAVWKVPEEELDDLGPRMAAFSAVSHCYKRPTYPDWPYSIFTMVHARSKEACEEAIAAIAEDTGITDPGPAGGPLLHPTSSRRSGSCTSRRTTASGRTSRRPGPPSRGGAAAERGGRRDPQRRALRPGAAGPGGRGQLARAGDARHRARPPVHRAGRGPARVGRRRQPVRRPAVHLGPGDPGPHAAGRGPRAGGRDPARHLLRRAHRARGGVRRGRLRGGPVGRAPADDVVRAARR